MLLEEKDDPRRRRCRLKVPLGSSISYQSKEGSLGPGFWREERGRGREIERLTTQESGALKKKCEECL